MPQAQPQSLSTLVHHPTKSVLPVPVATRIDYVQPLRIAKKIHPFPIPTAYSVVLSLTPMRQDMQGGSHRPGFLHYGGVTLNMNLPAVMQ